MFDLFVSLSVGVLAACVLGGLCVICHRHLRYRRQLKIKLFVVTYPQTGAMLSGLTADDVEFYRGIAWGSQPRMPFECREMTLEEKEAAYRD